MISISLIKRSVLEVPKISSLVYYKCDLGYLVGYLKVTLFVSKVIIKALVKRLMIVDDS